MAILISYQRATVKMMVRIFVVIHRCIVGCDTHDELVTKQGAYAELFETQAQCDR